MIIQNSYNGKTQEYYKYDDILESNLSITKLNSTKLEKYLMYINVGTKKRIRNNHAVRLARFKAI